MKSMPDITSNQVDQIKQALDAIKSQGTDFPAGQNFQMMLGALAMKRDPANIPPEIANHPQHQMAPQIQPTNQPSTPGTDFSISV